MSTSTKQTLLPQSKPSLVFIIAVIVAATGWFVYRTLTLNAGNGGTRSIGMDARIDGVFEAGEKAPYFEAYDFSGNVVSLDQFAGRPIILDFWAAWCVFCREEMPILQEIHQEMGERVHVVGVHRTDTGETLERGAQFAQEQGASYLLLQDPSGALYKAAAQGLSAMPAVVYIDSQGVVRDVQFGPKSAEDIRESVEDIHDQSK